MHSRLSESLESYIRFIRVVHNSGYNDWGGAMFQEIHFLGQSLISNRNAFQQIVNCPGHTVAFGLSSDDDGVELQELLDKLDVFLGNRLSVRALEHLWAEHSIMLGKGVVSFDLKTRLAMPRYAVEEDGFLNGRDKGMANASQHDVIRPDSQIVFTALF